MFTTLLKRLISNIFNLNFLIINLSSLIFLLILSCKKDLSPVKDRQVEIKLTVESAEVTEAWLKLETSPLESEAVYIVKRDTNFVFNGKLEKNDTLLHDENLLPAHEYNYSAYAVLNGKTGKIVKVSVTNMDTTSHDFEWEIFEWGHHSSSCLHDVAIISPEDIWAVGEIHTEDTDCWNEDSTEWIPPYNAVHWDGETWELKRIMYNYNGSPIFSTIRWIFAKSKNDIWFGNSVHWNGNQFHNVDIAVSIFTGIGINKMWISSNGELFVVGNKGTIAYSTNNGQSWQKIESGTELDIQDIWGAIDPQTEKDMILCIASNKYLNEGKQLLRIKDYEVYSINNEGLSWSLSGIWFIPNRIYYVVGAGIYPSRNLKNVWIEYINFPAIYADAVRGNSLNDVVVSGSNGLLSHFNGYSWKHYINNELPFIHGRYYSVDIKSNTIAAVGYNQRKAVIVIGKR